MKLAKIPEQLINVIKKLTKKWSTIVSMTTNESTTVTDSIRYLTGLDHMRRIYGWTTRKEKY